MKTVLPALLVVVILLSLLVLANLGAQAVAPDNPAWRQAQRDAELEYTIIRQAMVAFPAGQHPEVFERLSVVASQLEWYYQIQFGVPIRPVLTVPAALAYWPD